MDQQEQQSNVDGRVFGGADTSISLDDAQVKVASFRERILHLADYPEGVSKTIACHITLTDLQDMMKEQDMDGIRAYLGLRYDESVGEDVICLVMVGTRWNVEERIYQDIILDGVGGEYGIYDLTMPCPNTCDGSSPLNNLS